MVVRGFIDAIVVRGFLAVLVLPGVLAGCDAVPAPKQPPLQVKVKAAALEDFVPRLRITGVVSARNQSNLSFEIGGRVIERTADVGRHVEPGEVLARLDPKEQESDVEAAAAAVLAAEARLRQTTSVFERQQALLAQGFTTRRDYDGAEQSLKTARAQLDAARAQSAMARDRLGRTVLRATSAGVLTARTVEVGQVVQATEPVYTLAQDGPRDAVVFLQESVVEAIGKSTADVALASDSRVRASGVVREISPATEASTGTVRVKIGIEGVPAEMRIGSSVILTLAAPTRKRVFLPPAALTSDAGGPAVWVADPRTGKVALRPIRVEAFESAAVVVGSGLTPGDVVVVAGTQFLRPDQAIAFAEEVK
jgi:RND family efflux transporter MFP subunit